jgi:hypothetical protein
MELHELVSRLKGLASELDKTPTQREFVDSGISKRQINKFKYSEIVRAAGLEPNKHGTKTEGIEPVIRPPKILVFDIECTGMILESYGLYNQNHNHKDIIEDWSLLSYAAWFVGEEEIHYMDNRYGLDYRDDRQIVEGLHHLINEADWIIGHNSDRFDLKKFNAKSEKYLLDDIHEKTQWDTLKMLKSKYSLASNSLDYAAKYFDLKERKSGHGKFPGKSLFDECKKGNMEAWQELELYNKQDVKVTWELFQRLAKKDKRINMQSFYQRQVCICGNEKFHKDGFRFTRQGRFQIYRCNQCSKTFTAKENLIDKNMRGRFFK